jgi:hypothetical protein
LRSPTSRTLVEPRESWRSRADLEQAARDAGGRVEHVEQLDAYGRPWIASRITFADAWGPARLLVALTEQDAADPFVRAWALEIRRACDGDNECIARAIHASVMGHVGFVREPVETFQSARYTALAGLGDCDDHARLVGALGIAADVRPRGLAFFARTIDGEPQPIHVCGRLAGAFCETTVEGAAFGEHPRAAYRRISLDGGAARSDLG